MVALVALAALVHVVVSEELLVGSFNLRILGRTKIGNDLVMQRLVSVLLRYDLCLLQEVSVLWWFPHACDLTGVYLDQRHHRVGAYRASGAREQQKR